MLHSVNVRVKISQSDIILRLFFALFFALYLLSLLYRIYLDDSHISRYREERHLQEYFTGTEHFLRDYDNLFGQLPMIVLYCEMGACVRLQVRVPILGGGMWMMR